MTDNQVEPGKNVLTTEFWDSRFRESRAPWERGELNSAYLAWRANGTLPSCFTLVSGAGRSLEPLAMLQADVTT